MITYRIELEFPTVFSNLDDLMAAIREQIDANESVGDSFMLEVEYGEMTQEEFDALPHDEED